MKLITRIEYRTSWGQELFMRSGDSLFRMEYTPGDIWVGTVDRLKAGQTFEYRYELHQGGVCIRTEWNSHKIILTGRSQMEVRDYWSDVPADLPLHSAPFRNGVFKTEPGRTWRAAGTAVPVFSLRSEKSFGVGEFNDLKALVDWAAAAVAGERYHDDGDMGGLLSVQCQFELCPASAVHPSACCRSGGG